MELASTNTHLTLKPCHIYTLGGDELQQIGGYHRFYTQAEDLNRPIGLPAREIYSTFLGLFFESESF